MESYNTSEHGTEDMYMIQGSEKYAHSSAPLGQFEVMDNEGAPEFIVDQGLYYPAATNYYPYYCTGHESTGEWDDNYRFFGFDSPNLQYAGLQTDSLPYVYYTPNYGYAQSPFNPYNPYIPGAVIGVDGAFVGMQQYYSGSTYQQPAAPAYYPLVVQSIMENIPNNAGTYLLHASASAANGSDASGLKLNQPESDVTAKVLPKPGLVEGNKTCNQPHSSGKRSEIPKIQVENDKHPAKQASASTLSVSHSALSQVSQGRTASGAVQGTDKLTFGQASSHHAPVKVSMPVTNASPEFGTNARGWPMVDKYRPRVHYGGISNNGNENSDTLSEQNRGPRTNRSRGQLTASTSVEVDTTNSGTPSLKESIIVHPDHYNKEDFPVDYVDGKFFVIKSYSEDDVHKSIKYNIWSSTLNGNKRLDSAYEDAQRRAAGNPGGCPVFLFFSVNASGQFCGAAEMIGPVDFNRDMNFWQQDKWSGSFPVKWHIIKDVQNTNFRHIILENNENKPVTNSRDTQEIKYRQGIEMLKIFKNYTLKSSILDDFFYYEERQKIMQEEKARRHDKPFDSSFYIPAFVPPKKSICVVDRLCMDEVGSTLDRPSSSGNKVEQVSIKSDAPNSFSEEGSTTTKHDSVENGNGITAALRIGCLSVDEVPVESKPAAENTEATKHTSVEDENGATDVSKIGFLANDAKPVGTKLVRAATANTIDVFTVGSMPVKVNGFFETSGVLVKGSIPIVPKE